MGGMVSTLASAVRYWCKSSVSYVTVKNAKKNCKKRFDLYDYNNREDPTKVNMLVPKEEYALELPHPDSHLLNAEDEIFFYGTNSKSELLIVKICRELDNRAHACVYMKLANGKVYELVKTSDFQQSCTDEMTFSCGGLQLQCTYPMRAWRLFFAGYLRELSEDDPIDSQMRYVKFALLWRASSDVHDFLQDINMNYFPSSLSRVPWHGYRPHISEANRAMDFYGQAGVIHGTITIESESEDNEIYLFGQRIRYLGSTVHLKDLEFRHILGYVKTNGMYFHLGTISSSNIFKNYISGFVVQPDAKTKDIQKATILMSSFERGGKLKSDFSTESFDYTFNASANDLPSLNKITKCSHLKWLEFELNGEKGHGIIIERMQTIKEDNHYSEIHPIEVPPVVPPVVSFKEDICQLSEISGGKGSSLGKLTQLCKDIQTFTVPNGIVVTTSAYESFLTNPILVDIKDLEGKFYNDTSKPEDIKESCKRVAEAFVQTEFPNSLKECIHKSLISNFGEKIYSVKFAVRSSATGEDTEQMSAAGQMETYLGVSGLDETLLAVKKCWASQFSFIATDYKRRYGQRLNSPMAVVIQEMISCNVAGVLFTCDPLTGNPTLMSITSNYGLGESVVSGSEEPDIIQLKRDVNDELSITTITVGAKCRKVVVEDRQGTCTSEVPENERKVCSLSEDMTFRLANLAIKIEKHYRSHRDIEWGVFNDNIYIFQSRPVTSGTNETVYEIEHEFDGPIRVENDFYSVSNVGEVFPGAMSPLGMTVVMKSFTMLLNGRDVPDIQNRVKPNYFLMGGLIMYNHVLFNIADMFHDGLNDKVSIMEKAMMISYFGRLLKDKELFEVAQARYKGLPKMNPLLKLRVLAKIICFNNKRINKIMDDYSNYKIPVENYSTAKDLCHHLVRRCWDIVDVGFSHMLSSSSSAVWSMIIFATLGKAQGDFDDIVYHDFAMLVKTDSDVESADVPSAIQKLAFHISKSLGSSEFKRMTTKDAVKFLTTSTDETGKQFRKFLDTHGHRCLQEFDIYSQSWRENPASLVKLLQNSCGNVLKDTAEKDHDNVNELISKINIPLGFIDKKKLKFIIPLSRKSVQNRERTKSILMKVIDVWRQAYRKLAKLMFQEGLIPDDDLLFFMTLEEVTLFLENKSPKIIARATQRRRRFPVMHRYRFPEIMKGLPKPINEEENTTISNEDNFLMKGIPVSQGVAKGFLRKALYFEEAEEIKSGEILLTYSTDIAWTPYFPQLAGVVTELGGLISHGAVVSREYGIPCIAGLHGATKQFQTGDYVMLDGNKGILQKLKKPEN